MKAAQAGGGFQLVALPPSSTMLGTTGRLAYTFGTVETQAVPVEFSRGHNDGERHGHQPILVYANLASAWAWDGICVSEVATTRSI